MAHAGPARPGRAAGRSPREACCPLRLPPACVGERDAALQGPARFVLSQLRPSISMAL